MKTGFSLLLVFLSFSCQSATEKSMMSEEKLQSVYIALLKEGDHHRIESADTARSFKSDSIFHAYNTSAEEFRSTVAEYRREPVKWQKFFEGVVRKLDEKQDSQVKKPGR